MTQRAENNMREGIRGALGSDIPLQVSEQSLPAFYTKRNHIEARAAIVLPFSTAVLVMLDIMRL